MEKYEFIKNSADDYTLKYKDKEINFSSNVDIVNRLQNSIATARMKMIKDLAKEGISIKDLTIEKKENGKTYYDNTNKNELEKAYTEQEQGIVFMQIIKELFGMELQELFNDIGITGDQEGSEFSEQLGKILVGQFQSPRNKA